MAFRDTSDIQPFSKKVWLSSPTMHGDGKTMKMRLESTARRKFGFVPEFDDKPCKITEILLKQDYRNHFISLLFKGRCRKADVKQ